MSQEKDAFDVFEESPHASIVRLLSCGLDEGALLDRLCDEQIAGGTVEESKAIVWELEEISRTDQAVKYNLISSEFWFEELANVSQFEAHTQTETSPINQRKPSKRLYREQGDRIIFQRLPNTSAILDSTLPVLRDYYRAGAAEITDRPAALIAGWIARSTIPATVRGFHPLQPE